MDPLSSLFLIAALIAASAFFAIAELSVAASRRLRLRQMLEQGERRAAHVLAVQDEPGDFFTAIQIGVNTVAILGGVVGEGAFAPLVQPLLAALPRLDALTCRLIRERFRFRPSRSGAGKPVPAWIRENHEWVFERVNP